MNIKILTTGVVAFIAIVGGIYWMTVEQTDLSPLYTRGNEIISADTNQPITFQGVVSDYFRYNFNYNYPKLYGGLKSELEKIGRLNEAGANINIIGLYLAGLDEIKLNIDEIDEYIDYARDNNIYIYLAPTGNAFIETLTRGRDDLSELTEFLAVRYGNYPNVIFQLLAEPNMPYSDWEIKQRELATIVRKHTDNLMMVTTSYYSPYSSLPVLPYDNIIYTTGGYVSKDDSSFTERQIKEIVGQENLIQNYPVIVAEFGGNYGSDFSSARDLTLFKNLLEEIGHAKLSYTVYRLSSAFVDDGLALFDTESKLTKKGEVFVNFIRQ